MPLIDRFRLPMNATGAGLGERLLAAAPTAVAFGLVLVIAAQLASITWRLLAGRAVPEAAPVVAPPDAAPALDIAALVNAHLFGVAPADPDAAPAAAASNLVLVGTLAGPAPEQGWAIIGPDPQSARVHATGATLPGGARLVAVFADRVILDRAGRREYLALPRLTGGAGGPPPAVAPNAAVLPPAGIRELLPRAAGASEILRPQPVFAGGQLRGYRVYPGRNRQQFIRLGLQPGDLVTAVNGAPLDDPGRGLEALQGLAGGGSATLTIDRNGQVQQVTVDVASVAPAEDDDVEPPSQPPAAEATE